MLSEHCSKELKDILKKVQECDTVEGLDNKDLGKEIEKLDLVEQAICVNYIEVKHRYLKSINSGIKLKR